MNLCGLIEDAGDQLHDWGLFEVPLLGSWLMSRFYLLMCLFCGGL